MAPSFPRPLTLTALLVLLAHSACQRSTNQTAKPLSTGIDVLSAEPFPESGDAPQLGAQSSRESQSLESRIAQSALDLDQIFKNRTQGDASARRADGRSSRRASAVSSDGSANDGTSASGVNAADPIAPTDEESSIALATPAANVNPKPADNTAKVATVASQLAQTLRQRSDPAAGKPMPDALVLSTLESLQPGFFTELQRSDSPISKALTREDRKELLSARDRVAADPNARLAASDSIAQTIQTFAPPSSLQITKSCFCTRVEGFGRYTALGAETFLVGQPIRVLIYTELDGFSARAARAGDPGMSAADPAKYAVELSQSLTLYHDPSGLVAWQRPPQAVIEPCKAKRRDFFLVQRLSLPATLSVGKYNLKVRVTDVTSGSEAESILPIHVVADPALVRR